MTDNPLEREIARYKEELEVLLAEEGRFALVKSEEKIDIFDTYDDALKAGYERYGLEPFLVQKISRVPSVANFTRFSLTPCQV